jgi:hypothetical protein
MWAPRGITTLEQFSRQGYYIGYVINQEWRNDGALNGLIVVTDEEEKSL